MATQSRARDCVMLVSCEGHQFVVERHVALMSPTIQAALQGSFSETRDSTMRYPNISTRALQEVIAYCSHKALYRNCTEHPQFKIDPAVALDTLTAANYLGV